MMDLIVIAVAGAIVLVLLFAATVLFIRWRRNRYRFSIRALLLLFALTGAALFALMRFVAPIVAHRWAVQQIYSSGGLLFRDDFKPNSSQVYSDPTTANPWRDVAIIHAVNDSDAITVALQLKYLPETESIFLSSAVTDRGLIAICDSEPVPSFGTLDLLNSRVTAAGLAHLAKLKQLRTLFFNSCPIHDADLACLKSLDTLRDLTLLEELKSGNPNRFNEAGFREVGQLKNLEKLWLANLKISDAAARDLKSLTHLKKLLITRCQISGDAIAELRQTLP